MLDILKDLEVGTLSGDCLKQILDLIEKICTEKYTRYDIVSTILNALYSKLNLGCFSTTACNQTCLFRFLGLFPHIARVDQANVKSLSIDLLYTFLGCYDNYGPGVSVQILKCLGMLAKVDPEASWSKYEENTVLSHKILQFLSSDYQEVRLAAVENLVILFENLCARKELFCYQKVVFEEIYPKVSSASNNN